MTGGAERRGKRERTRPASIGPAAPAPAGSSAERVLGRVEGGRPGPVLLCVAGVHGNEPAGVVALRRGLERIRDRADHMAGRVVALAGNLGALSEGERYVSHDLNRLWAVGAARDPDAGAAAEHRERRELLRAMDEAVAGQPGPVHLLDLHTTSGEGGAFTTVADTLANRMFAMAFPVPLVLGLEELVDGTLLEHGRREGWVTTAFESGQHEELRAVDRAEAAFFIALSTARILPETSLPELAGSLKLLRGDARGVPRVVEMRYRHAVEPGDGFHMAPGFRNFQKVVRGELLGRDRAGDVTAPESGRILMPLYQRQGSDGFFIVREFRPFWLHLSRMLRRVGAAKLVHWLPGIRRLPGRPGALEVDRRVARWYALQVLHLLGYRRLREEGDRLVVVGQERPVDGPPDR